MVEDVSVQSFHVREAHKYITVGGKYRLTEVCSPLFHSNVKLDKSFILEGISVDNIDYRGWEAEKKLRELASASGPSMHIFYRGLFKVSTGGGRLEREYIQVFASFDDLSILPVGEQLDEFMWAKS